MCLPKEELIGKAQNLLSVDSVYMEKHLTDLALDRKIVVREEEDGVMIYPAVYYYTELNTARMLTELKDQCPKGRGVSTERIEEIEKNTGTVLDEMQRKAVSEAAENGVFGQAGSRQLGS